MKKVIVTGATGFIGQQSIEPLLNKGYEVYAITHNQQPANNNNYQLINANIFDSESIKKVFSEIKPEYLLHFAWDTRPGIYLQDNSNFEWLAASLQMLKTFQECGGRRAIYAGTCFEYKFSDEKLAEESTELSPISIYGNCKNHLNQLAKIFAKKNELSFGWGRIFYVYGPNEHEKRLTTYIINSLINKQQMTIKSGKLIKDYLYTKDIAAAFVEFLDSQVEGAVNICSGIPISVSEFALTIAEKYGREDLLTFEDAPPAGEPPIILGDNTKLKNGIGFSPKYDLNSGIDEILNQLNCI